MSCWRSSESVTGTTPGGGDRATPAGLDAPTAPVVRRALGAQLRVPGVVEAPENAAAQVHVRAAGFLERVEVRQGGVRVARGQTLAWIYAPEIYQAEQEMLTARRWAGAAPDGGMTEPGHDDVFVAARRRLQFLGVAYWPNTAA